MRIMLKNRATYFDTPHPPPQRLVVGGTDRTAQNTPDSRPVNQCRPPPCEGPDDPP
jgi:hypothetical protein